MLGTRTTAVIAIATAAVVLGVLTGAVVLLRDDDQGPLQRGPIAVTPSGPSSSAPSPEPGTVLDELPHGAAPAIGFVEDHVYLAPDGTRSALPGRRGISRVVAFAGGFLVSDTRYFEGTSGLVLVSGGTRQKLGPCSSGPGASSRDGRTAAWVTFGCPESLRLAPTVLHRTTSGHTVHQKIATPPDTSQLASVVGFLGDDVVLTRGFGQQAFLTDPTGTLRTIPDVSTVVSVDEVGGLVAGQRGASQQHAVVLDPRTGVHRWQAPHIYLGEFSPDGSLIPGQGRGGWSVYDRTGSIAYRLDLPSRSHLSSMAWEDQRHLLAVVTTAAKIAIVRFGANGRAELATPVVHYDPNDPAYVLAVRP